MAKRHLSTTADDVSSVLSHPSRRTSVGNVDEKDEKCDTDRYGFADALLQSSAQLRRRTEYYIDEVHRILDRYDPGKADENGEGGDEEFAVLWGKWLASPASQIVCPSSRRRSAAAMIRTADEADKVDWSEEEGESVEECNINEIVREQRRDRRKSKELPHTGRKEGRRKRRHKNVSQPMLKFVWY
mmetsp:Transcript_16945/g.38121  ORF Transcript_16945/g.38121 Transcript_16945/m.38121 type:complete len:186 (-) Transcript_16945:650-1207(-)